MLTCVSLTPSAPVLVPELAGAASQEVASIRDGALRAARALPGRWLVVGVGNGDAVLNPDSCGTFAGYGADVPVRLGPDASGTPAELPLCALFAGWLRGQVNPGAAAQVRVLDAATPAETAVEYGRTLRAEIDRSDEPSGVLIVADGATTLTQAAPGGYDADSEAVQHRLDEALRNGDAAELRDLPNGIAGRAAYQVLAGLGGGTRWRAEEFSCGAPYGVGYFTGVWTPA